MEKMKPIITMIAITMIIAVILAMPVIGKREVSFVVT